MNTPSNARRFRKSHALGLGALAALGVAAAALGWPWGGAAAPGAAGPAANAPGAPRPAGFGLRWTVGEARTYDVHVTSRTSVALGDAFPGGPGKPAAQPAITTSLRGAWRTEVFAEREGDALVRAAFEVRDIDVRANGTSVERSALEALRGPAALPVVVRLGRDGRVEGLRVPAELAAQPLLVGSLKTVVASLQAVYPRGVADPTRWQGDEQDGAGLFRASYARNDGELVKRKGDYSALGGPSGLRQASEASVRPASRAVMAVDEAGWVTSVVLHETLTLLQKSNAAVGAADQVVAEAKNDVEAKQVAYARAGAGAGAPAGWEDIPERPLAHVFATPGDEPARALPELLGDLRATDRVNDAGEREQAQARLMPELADGLRRNPQAARAIGGELRAAGVDRGRASTLLAALSTAGTPEAQHELVSAWRDAGLEASVRAQALAQLTFVESPSPEAAEAAKEAATSTDQATRGRGSLVLGAIAHQLGAPGESETSQPLVETLLGLARGAADDAALVTALDALGNAGSPASMGALLAALRSPKALVRNAAVRALRLMPPGPADGAIRQVLGTDPAGPVREGAVFAAGFREPQGYAELVAGRALVEPSVAVRRAIVAWMGNARPKVPALDATLDHVSRHDADEAVREAARRALAGPTQHEGTSTSHEADVPGGGGG